MRYRPQSSPFPLILMILIATTPLAVHPHTCANDSRVKLEPEQRATVLRLWPSLAQSPTTVNLIFVGYRQREYRRQAFVTCDGTARHARCSGVGFAPAVLAFARRGCFDGKGGET